MLLYNKMYKWFIQVVKKNTGKGEGRRDREDKAAFKGHVIKSATTVGIQNVMALENSENQGTICVPQSYSNQREGSYGTYTPTLISWRLLRRCTYGLLGSNQRGSGCQSPHAKRCRSWQFEVQPGFLLQWERIWAGCQAASATDGNASACKLRCLQKLGRWHKQEKQAGWNSMS